MKLFVKLTYFFVKFTLEVYLDEGGYVTFMPAIASWRLTDQRFVLFIPPTKEVDWFGKQSLFVIEKNACHPSKPENEDGLVRATVIVMAIMAISVTQGLSKRMEVLFDRAPNQ